MYWSTISAQTYHSHRNSKENHWCFFWWLGITALFAIKNTQGAANPCLVIAINGDTIQKLSIWNGKCLSHIAWKTHVSLIPERIPGFCYCTRKSNCILVEKRRNIKDKRPATKLETAHCLMFIPIQLKRTMAGTHYISAQIYYISVSEVMYSIFLWRNQHINC